MVGFSNQFSNRSPKFEEFSERYFFHLVAILLRCAAALLEEFHNQADTKISVLSGFKGGVVFKRVLRDQCLRRVLNGYPTKLTTENTFLIVSQAVRIRKVTLFNTNSINA